MGYFDLLDSEAEACLLAEGKLWVFQCLGTGFQIHFTIGRRVSHHYAFDGCPEFYL